MCSRWDYYSPWCCNEWQPGCSLPPVNSRGQRKIVREKQGYFSNRTMILEIARQGHDALEAGK